MNQPSKPSKPNKPADLTTFVNAALAKATGGATLTDAQRDLCARIEGHMRARMAHTRKADELVQAAAVEHAHADKAQAVVYELLSMLAASMGPDFPAPPSTKDGPSA
jgi:hypothetical protein